MISENNTSYLINSNQSQKIDVPPKCFKSKFKVLVPQIVAAIVASSFYIIVGISIGYSSILVPQLRESQNSTNENVIRATENEITWTVSMLAMVAPIGALTGGVIMDTIGRIKIVQLSALIGILGWVLIATASNVSMLIAGRVLTGIIYAWGTSPATVYVSEISRPDVRGSLTALGPVCCSIGILLVYTEGWLMNWKLVAWSCNAYILLILILLMFLPESPSWLLLKGRTDKALKSLEWLHKFESPTVVETELLYLKRYQLMKQEESNKITGSRSFRLFKLIVQPTIYRPFIIAIVLFFFQQFSGVFVVLCYAVTFFDDIGTSINPYLASVFIGVARFGISLINIWIFKKIKRRTLMLASGIGMALSIGISATCTVWIDQDSTLLKWIPVLMIVTYVVSSTVGFFTIPWIMAAELFPLTIRGIANSIVTSVANFLTFVIIQNYPTLNGIFGGSSGVQYFFAIFSLLGVIYCFIFLPETHEKNPTEIEEYFSNNITYIFSAKKNEHKNGKFQNTL